ncbi:MAG: ATP-binding cassette domain-containing protein, partial [Bacteroidota bacterium]|nr:ATP-binding cassette domain-containing protein [Bacteroidota bacterium]
MNIGKIYAILGANGSGKTTLLNILSGLLQPENGTVLLNERKVEGPQERLVPGHPEISLVKQDNSLFPLHTVRANLQYVLQSHPNKTQNDKILMLSKLLGLDANLDKQLKNLSGGEQQRVAIAAALAKSPK